MPTGKNGTDSTPNIAARTERVLFTERTSDPATPLKGEWWFRSDFDSGTDKYGELRWYDGSSVNSVPVFATGVSGPYTEEVLRLQTVNGLAFVPITDSVDAAYPELRFRHGGSDYALNDDKSLGIIDDFEDGNISNPTSPNWSGWTKDSVSGSFASVGVDATTDLKGSNALHFQNSNTGDSANITISATRSSSTTTDLRFLVYIEQQPPDNTNLRVRARTSGTSIGGLVFNGDGTYEWISTQVGTWSTNTLYEMTLVWDWANDQVEIFEDGVSQGTYAFNSSASSFDELEVTFFAFDDVVDAWLDHFQEQ